MDKALREQLIAYMDAKNDISKKLSIEHDLLNIHKEAALHDYGIEYETSEVAFHKGKIAAYETIDVILTNKINKIRGITDEDKTHST